MRDKFTPPESDRPGLEPDSIDGMSRPGNVDQLVSSFLSELNTLSDALGLDRDQPAEGSDGVSSAADRPGPVDAQPAAPKPVSYRNIDVLLMDNRQFLGGRERTRDESPHTNHGLFESQSPARSAGARRRRILLLICFAALVTLLGALGVLYQAGYFAPSQATGTKDIAAPLHASSSAGGPVSPASLPGVGGSAPLPGAISPAVAIQKVTPRYPTEAKRLGVKGAVELDADVDTDGKVVRALAVSGPLLLRSAAEEALLKWRFKPAQRGGIKLKSTARVSVVFNP